MVTNLAEKQINVQGAESAAPRACIHCKTPLRKNQSQFCCRGCEGVFRTIHTLGLSPFYNLKARDTSTNLSPAQPGKSYAYLLDPEVYSQCIEQMSEELSTVRFYLPTIHCAACVWILEKLPHVIEGVQISRVSFTSGQIEIVFNHTLISLDNLASILHSIGYPPVPAISQTMEAQNRREERIMLMRIGVAAVCAANTMMLADSLFQSFFTGMDQHFIALFTWTSALIALPAVTWAAAPFYRAAIGTLVTGRVHIDLPISIAIIASYFADLVATIRGSAHVYFDSITSLIFLLLVARYIQRRALIRSRASTTSSWDLLPAIVRVVEEDALVEKTIRALQIGDIIEIRPEERIPADGTVTSGTTTIDSSFLTGESKPLEVEPGDAILGGSINVGSTIELKVEEIGEKTRLGKILEGLKRSQGRSTKVEDDANKLSSYFVLTVLFVSIATFTWWYFFDSSRALEVTIAFLVITCPCALGLAVPVSAAVALSQARTSRLFIQNPDSLHLLAGAENFYFDKTGTLTQGALTVVEYSGSPFALEIAKTLSGFSSLHPVPKAIERYLNESRSCAIKSHKLCPGKGMTAELLDGSLISIGSLRWFISRGVEIPIALSQHVESWILLGHSVSLVEHQNKCIGAFGLQDEITQAAHHFVELLQRQGKKVFILSGDNQKIVDSVALALNIPITQAFGDLYPEEKAQKLSLDTLTTVMVGDGLNDALAMQQADISVGVRGGVESTLETVDIFVSERGIDGLREAVSGSSRMRATIRLNLGISLVYNIFGAALAVTGYVTPLVAAILMPISSLTVILIAASQRYFKPYTKKCEEH